MRNVARGELLKYAKSEPLLVFIISYAMQWNEEAAASLLNQPLLTLDDKDILKLDILRSLHILYSLFKMCLAHFDAVRDDDSIIGVPMKRWFVKYRISFEE
ncbi:hypothetical protein DFS33DRAFT_1276911 [Desarmillaria ectypa]|nr:hypothetical protein DFS33DRAFT_1276911 [Desarmillaria ectypa]